MTCCDPATYGLRDASFRGVSFWVDNDKGAYGRRLVVHEFAGRDDPYLEDMGEKAATFSVKAYLPCDMAGAKDALVAACTAGGSAILVLPAEAPQLVKCSSITVTRSKDKTGWYDVELNFNREGATGADFVTSVFSALIDGLMDVAAEALVDVFDAVYSLADGLPWITARVFDRLVDAAGIVMSLVQTNASVDAVLSAALYRDAFVFANSATVYMDGDPADTQIPAAMGTLLQRLGAVLPSANTPTTGTLVSTATAASVFKELCGFDPVPPVETPLGPRIATSVTNVFTADGQLTAPSDAIDRGNDLAIIGGFRVLAFIQWCKAVADGPYDTRAEAVQARADISEAAYNLSIAFDDYANVVKVISDARDYAVKAVTKSLATLSPVVTITSNLSLPSLYWAYRLYGDPARFAELADRNGVPNPSYMPPNFEALTT